MKNNTKPQDTEPKAKMLFNSDGFDFVVKVIIELFKIFGMVLIAVFSIIGVLLSANSSEDKKKKNGYYHEEDNCLYDEDNQPML